MPQCDYMPCTYKNPIIKYIDAIFSVFLCRRFCQTRNSLTATIKMWPCIWNSYIDYVLHEIRLCRQAWNKAKQNEVYSLEVVKLCSFRRLTTELNNTAIMWSFIATWSSFFVVRCGSVLRPSSIILFNLENYHF